MLLTILYLFIVPLLVVIAAKRWPIIEKISPMVILYIIGLIVGNVGIMGEKSLSICTNVSNVVVLISIPLMLLGCDFRNWSAKTVLKTFLVGLFSILIVTVAGFFIFRGQAINAELSTEDFARVSAAMTGIYTGGIPNFAPVSKAVNLPQHLFLMVSGYDLVVTGLYLIFIVFAGRSIVRWFFPKKELSPTLSDNEETTSETETATETKSFWQKVGNRAIGIGVAVVLVAASYGLSLILPIENTTAVIIITLTTLSILLSFWKPVKRLEGTFDVGLYFVYVFCLAVATMVNIHDLEFSKYIFILYYIAFAVFGSLVLQILFARLFKIDGDMTLAASIALINSPPFVPMVSAVLHNKDIILPGIAIGLLGYAVGNYLGIGIFMLLSAI
jgi:uncharacterized membrane protein